jgi:hypothetical protein
MSAHPDDVVGGVRISSHLPDIVDAYISIRAQRLQLERQVNELKEQEDLLNGHIINHLRIQGMTAVGGKAGFVKLRELDEPEVQDWTLLYEFIKNNDAWELLHRRVGSTAVKERWEAGEQVPGVGHKSVYKLSVSGAK